MATASSSSPPAVGKSTYVERQASLEGGISATVPFEERGASSKSSSCDEQQHLEGDEDDEEGGELDLNADVLIDEDTPLRLLSAVECLELCDRLVFCVGAGAGGQRAPEVSPKAHSVSSRTGESITTTASATTAHKGPPAAAEAATSLAPEKRVSTRGDGSEFWAKLRARVALFEASAAFFEMRRAHEPEHYPVLLSSRLVNALAQAQLRPTPPPQAPPQSQWATSTFEQLDAQFLHQSTDAPEFLGRDSSRWIASLSTTRPNEFLLVRRSSHCSKNFEFSMIIRSDLYT